MSIFFFKNINISRKKLVLFNDTCRTNENDSFFIFIMCCILLSDPTTLFRVSIVRYKGESMSVFALSYIVLNI